MYLNKSEAKIKVRHVIRAEVTELYSFDFISLMR